jgi:hypothetical protein
MDATSPEVGRIAVVEARVRHYGEELRDEVVLRSGDTLGVHEARRHELLRAMAREAARQELAVSEAYAHPFAAERRRLASERPPLASLGELPEAAVVEPTPPAPAEQDAQPAAEPAAPPAVVPADTPLLVPSYLREAAATPAPVEIRLAHFEAAGPDSTQPPIRRDAPAMPFAPGRAGEIPEGVRAASAEARAAADAEEREEPTRASAGDGDETAFLPRSAFNDPATPFEKKKVESAQTMALDEAQLRAAAATPEPWIGLEEYAAFLGELAKDPSRAGILRAKYGIAGEDAQRALGAGFAAKFQADPSLRVRFDALLAVERAKR